MTDKLNLGDTFPSLTFNKVGGGTFAVPEAGAKYNVILFYRGHW
jgi:peroxiredoxin